MMKEMSDFEKTPRTTVRRHSERGTFDREQVYKILDEGFLCHLGFTEEAGYPVVIPTAYGRQGDIVYLHGAVANRALKMIGGKAPVCLTVTLFDGFVLARSAFHHSMNYRSVVIFGDAEVVTGAAEKEEALRVISEQLIPGRWAEVRQPSPKELGATQVLALPLIEASAKIRTGGPIDDKADLDLDVWAGVLPFRLTPGTPVADALMTAPRPLPDSVVNYRIPG